LASVTTSKTPGKCAFLAKKFTIRFSIRLFIYFAVSAALRVLIKATTPT